MFLYGQTYMLGVEAWLAAPLFALFGASATALKLPLLADERRDRVAAAARRSSATWACGRCGAALAALPFVLPVGRPVGACFVDSSGGSLEPYPLRAAALGHARPPAAAAALVFGIGFLNREFTLYGLAALACLEALDGRLFTRAGRAPRWRACSASRRSSGSPSRD